MGNTLQMKLIWGSLASNWCYLTLVHPSIRKIKKENEPHRFYPDVHMILLDSRTGKVKGSLLGCTDRVMTMEVMLDGGTEYDIVLFTMLPSLHAYKDWNPTIRLFSASPVEIKFDSRTAPVVIPTAMFERLLVDSIPIVEKIQIGDSLSINIHSSQCLTIFSSVYGGGGLCGELKVHVSLKTNNLRSIGRWTRRLRSENIGQSVLGIITQIKTRYASNNARLDGYEFEVELVPVDDEPLSPERKRLKPNTEVIELD